MVKSTLKTIKKYQRALMLGALGCTLAVSLQGCFLLAGGAIVGGSFAAADRRTLGAQAEDKGIMVKGKIEVNKVVPDSAHVDITSFNRRALLTGEVPTEEAKQAAEKALRGVENVDEVYNELAVTFSSTLSGRSSDSLVTTKVVASLIDEKFLQSHAIKVVTERGNVYLMGIVTEREAKLAATIASRVDGVKRVVTYFEYASDEDVKKMSNPQPQSEQTMAN